MLCDSSLLEELSHPRDSSVSFANDSVYTVLYLYILFGLYIVLFNILLIIYNFFIIDFAYSRLPYSIFLLNIIITKIFKQHMSSQYKHY